MTYTGWISLSISKRPENSAEVRQWHTVKTKLLACDLFYDYMQDLYIYANEYQDELSRFFYRILLFYMSWQYDCNTSEIGCVQTSVQQIPHLFYDWNLIWRSLGQNCGANMLFSYYFPWNNTVQKQHLWKVKFS